MSKQESQHTTILKHLVEHRHLTSLEAFGLYRIFNLKGRITELRGCSSAPARFRAFPVNVKSEMMEDGTGKVYARYSIDDHEKSVIRGRYPSLFRIKEAA